MELMSEKVFGFTFEESKCKAFQEFVTVAETSLGEVIDPCSSKILR